MQEQARTRSAKEYDGELAARESWGGGGESTESTVGARRDAPGRGGGGRVRGCREASDPYAKGMARVDSGEFELGGDRFSWSVKYYGGESSANTHERGLSVRVALAEAQMRELVIEFDAQDYPPKRPASPAQLAVRIQAATQEAIDAGWRPESRGKPFRFTAPRMVR